MLFNTDIDIDFANKDAAQVGLACVPACQLGAKGSHQRHPSGVYFQNIPVDPLTGLAVFDYERAQNLGYFKIDFLNLSLYNDLTSDEHLISLVNRDPDWSYLEEQDIVEQLTQIGNHFHIVSAIKPQSVEDLAVVCALMRPGKLHLIGQPRSVIDAEIWKPAPGDYSYKRAHAIAYATSIVVQLNILIEHAVQTVEDQRRC